MTTAEIREAKREIRDSGKRARAEMDRNTKTKLDKEICKKIISSQSFKYADAVLMFYPTENEIDILPMFYKAKELGKKVYFPKCTSKGIMKFYLVEDVLDMKTGKYGISEPVQTEEGEFSSSAHPLCIVPCLAASRDGMRVGYGGGYYDRFLAGFDGISMCIQYESLVSAALPVEKRYDKKTDILVTEEGVFVVGQKKQI